MSGKLNAGAGTGPLSVSGVKGTSALAKSQSVQPATGASIARSASPPVPPIPVTRDVLAMGATVTGALPKAADLSTLRAIFQRHPSALEMLDKMNADGRLAAKDMSGVTLAERLVDLAMMPEVEGGVARPRKEVILDSRTLLNAAGPLPVSGMKLALDVLWHLDRPSIIRQGEKTYTCGPGVAQQALARLLPADYARMVYELASQGESQTVRGNLVVKADLRGFLKSERRDAVEDLMQESLASFAHQQWPDTNGSGLGRRIYGSVKKLGNRLSKAVRRLGGEASTQVSLPVRARKREASRALSFEQHNRLMSALTGSYSFPLLRKDVDSSVDAKQMRAFGILLSELGKLTGIAVGIRQSVEANPSDVGHALSFQRLADKGTSVLLYEPASGTNIKVPLDQFLKDLVYLALPVEPIFRGGFILSPVQQTVLMDNFQPLQSPPSS